MTSIIDFINSHKENLSTGHETLITDFIYIGIYRDYYLNVVPILCDINVYYYLDEKSLKDLGSLLKLKDDSSISIISDSTVDIEIENIILKIKEDLGSSIKENKKKIKIIYKDLKTSEFKIGKIKPFETDKLIKESSREEEIKKEELPDPRSGLDLYEFEILNKLLIPISIL